jgi:hypothetical protein
MLPHAEHVLTTALIVKNKSHPMEYNIGFVGVLYYFNNG